MNKKRFLIGMLLAAFFLYLFLRNIDLHEVWRIIRTGAPLWLAVAVVFNVLNFFVRSVRWRWFLLPLKKASIWNLYNTTVIGFAVSAIFPARVGELVRPYLLGEKEKISKSAAFATIIVERLFDTMTVLLMLVVYLLLLVQPEQLGPKAISLVEELQKAGLVMFVFAAAIVLFLYYLKTKPTLIKRLAAKVERLLPSRMAHSIEDLLDSFIEGLSILHDPKILLQIMAWSIFLWLVISVSFWAGVKAFLPQFPFTGTFLIMILLAIGIAIPTPGGVGSYHLACKIGLTVFFGVSDVEAGAVALVSHAIATIPVTVQGIFHLWHEGLSTGKITKIAEEEEAVVHHHPSPDEPTHQL